MLRGRVRAAQQPADQRDHVDAGPSLRGGAGGQGEHRAVVGLAAGQPGHLGRRDDHDPAGSEPELVAHQPGHPPDVDRGGAGTHREHQPVAAVGGRGHDTAGGEQLLHVVEVDPEAEDLGDPAAAPDHLEQSVVPLAADVTGPQGGHGAAEGQVGRGLGVPQHHVGPVVDELADLGVVRPRERPLGERLDGERPARDRDADGAGGVEGQQRRQPGHPGGRLGLAVHHEQVPPALAAQRGPAAYVVRGEAAAGLGEVAQVREVHVGEADPVEELEGVGHAGQGGGPVGAHVVPERRVDHGVVGEQEARPGQQVAVHDGESVAVVHRQHRRCDVAGGEVEVGGDRAGVGEQVVAGEPHQLGRAGGARGREQQREVGVQVDPRLGTPLDQARVPAPEDVGVVGVHQAGGGRRRGQQHRAPGGEGAEVGDQRVGVVVALDEDQATGGPQPARERRHPSGQIGVGQPVPGPGAEQRGPVAVRREVRDQGATDQRGGEVSCGRGRRRHGGRRESGRARHPGYFIR